MIKRLLLALALVLSLSSCGEDAAYRIKGELANLNDQTIYAVFESENGKDIDTLVCEQPGKFLLEKADGNFERVTFLWENKSSWITVFLEKGGEVCISGDARYPALLQVKGGKLNNELTKFREQQADLWREQADLSRNLESEEVSSIDKSDLMARLANVNLQLDEAVIAYIAEHPDHRASLVLMQFFYMNPEHLRYLDKALTMIPTEKREDPLFKDLEQYSIRAKRAMPGSEAPAFSVKNIHGETVSLDTDSGEYIALIFTAPWVEVYTPKRLAMESFVARYPADKLKVIMVSLDTDPETVRKMLDGSKVKWNLVTDSAGQATELLDLYNVSSLPRCFLIDKNRKICLKTDSGSELEKEMKELMRK